MNCSATLLTYGRMNYAAAWALQRAFVEERIEDQRVDTLVLLEHEPVFTIGRVYKQDHCDENSLLKRGYPVYHVERGGSVTYHGPGQIVGYPILRLAQYCAGPKTYIRMLEEVVIRTLADWGITGSRAEKLPGVWVGQEKIAAVGVRIIRGVTMHGFALNATVDVAPFAQIVPCGIAGCRVTSMARLLGDLVDVLKVRQRVAGIFADIFGLEWTEQVTTNGTNETASVSRTIETSETSREANPDEFGMRMAWAWERNQ
jgi:lipoyl(octanoyl) transferase